MNISLSQFYESGPYLHQRTNTIPFYAAYFSASGRDDTVMFAQLDDLIDKMKTNEMLFLAHYGVKTAEEFESIFLTNTHPSINDFKTSTTSEKIAQKIGEFLAQELPLRFKTEGIFDDIIDTLIEQFFGTKIVKQIGSILRKNYPDAIDKQATATNIINAFNRTSMDPSDRRMFKRSIERAWTSANPGNADLGPIVLLRDRQLLSDIISPDELNPIVRKELFGLNVMNNLKKQINVNKIHQFVTKSITQIFATVDTEKEYSDKFIKEVIGVIKRRINKWLSYPEIVKFLSTDASSTGALGEYGASFLFSFLMVNPIDSKGVKELTKTIEAITIGEAKGTTIEKVFNPRTGLIETVHNKDGNFKKRTESLSSDIAFPLSGPNKNDFYALQIKNSLNSALDMGEVGIRGGIQVSKVIGDMIDAQVMDIPDAKKFAYVLVNNVYRMNSKFSSPVGVQMFLDRFVAMVANFYLQTEYLNKLVYAGKQSNMKVGNSFIIYRHKSLIAMSTIFSQLRDYLKQEGSAETPLYALSTRGESNFAAQGKINGREMTRRKKLAGIIAPNWVSGQPYGGAMMEVGLKYGTEMFNQIKMPSVNINMKKLVGTISGML